MWVGSGRVRAPKEMHSGGSRQVVSCEGTQGNAFEWVRENQVRSCKGGQGNVFEQVRSCEGAHGNIFGRVESGWVESCQVM